MESQKVSDQKSRADIIAESKKPGGLLPTDLIGFQKIGQDFGTGRIAKEKAAYRPEEESPRYFCVKRPGKKRRCSIRWLWIRKLEKTIKGRSVGTSVENQRFRPYLAPSSTIPGKNSRKVKATAEKSEAKKDFIKFPFLFHRMHEWKSVCI